MVIFPAFRVQYPADEHASIDHAVDAPVWTHQRLSTLIQNQLSHRQMVIVANREPLIQCGAGHQGAASKAVSGLVSALFPFMMATGGTWVSHASGQQKSTDFEGSSGPGRAVTGDSEFNLRKVFSNGNEYRQYYEEYSNKGLWPLCHIAFTEPRFTAESWSAYRKVNQRIADAVLQEVSDRPAIIFVQDYHLGLLPRMLKQAKADLLIAQFWHIPWPPWDIFRTCPNHQQIIEGLLGNDLLGFQLPEHCHNFMACIEAIHQPTSNSHIPKTFDANHKTEVHQFPISIDALNHQRLANGNDVINAMATWSTRLNCERVRLGLGVERLDYTKGIVQRLHAIRRLFDHNQELIGAFTFVQIATLSRLALDDYQQLQQDVIQLVNDINTQHGLENWQPIVLDFKSYDQVELIALERLASFCIVSSLHDGMNLVAKEFCASRIDNQGVLILSQFTGSALELDGAIAVNPFSIDMLTDAMIEALAMEPKEMESRMKKMRSYLLEHNVYRWGANIAFHLIKLDAGRRPC